MTIDTDFWGGSEPPYGWEEDEELRREGQLPEPDEQSAQAQDEERNR